MTHFFFFTLTIGECKEIFLVVSNTFKPLKRKFACNRYFTSIPTENDLLSSQRRAGFKVYIRG